MEGEVAGVSSKGVGKGVSLTNSKFERLDDGLVLASDGALAILDGIGVRMFAGFGMTSAFFVKRPELSLVLP